MKTKEKRCVVVTGGAGGLGEAIVRKFRATASDLVIIADTNESAGERLQEEVGAYFIKTDVCDYQACEGLAMAVSSLSFDGGIDVLVANVGSNEGKSTGKIGVAGWEHSIRLNLSSVFNTVLASLDFMNVGGTVEIVSSLVGIVGQFPGSAYAAAKGGLITYAKSLALELVSKRVTTKVICPHAINTPMLYEWARKQPEGEEEAIKKLKASLLQGELLEPADIAEWAFFLASPAAAIMTGQNVVLDGGASLGC